MSKLREPIIRSEWSAVKRLEARQAVSKQYVPLIKRAKMAHSLRYLFLACTLTLSSTIEKEEEEEEEEVKEEEEDSRA